MFKSTKVELKKPDGRIYEFEAMVQSELIFTNNTSIPIEIGDTIIRKLRNNGLVEEYEVLNPQYYDQNIHISGGGPQVGTGHYQIKVRKFGIGEKNVGVPSVNFYGDTTFGDNTMIGNNISIGEEYIRKINGISETDKEEIIKELEVSKQSKDINAIKNKILPKILNFSKDVAANVLAGIIMYYTGFQSN